jgi:type I restriction enzyme, S subunit
MPTVQSLVADHLNIWTTAIQKKSSSGRGTNKKLNLYGIKKLRELILELALRGQLVPQDPSDEPASVLLKKIVTIKEQLIKKSEIKKQKALPRIKDDEKPFELPPGWKWARLGDVGTVFNGNSISAHIKKEKYEGVEGLPFIATKDVGYGFEYFDYNNGVAIPEGEANFKIAHKNAVFICAEGGSAGKKCGITDRDICFGNKLFANELFEGVVPVYILAVYLTPFFYNLFSKSMTGIIGGISSKKFMGLPIPIPPSAEQRRIVAKIDELMALCDQLERQTEDSLTAHQALVETLLATLTESKDAEEFAQNWSRVAEHFDILFTTEDSIDQLKQTILQLAVMGKLVPQNPSDDPVSVLLEKIDTEKAPLIKEGKIKKQKLLPPISDDEKPFKLPTAWDWSRIEALVDPERDISYGIIKLEKEPLGGGISTLRCSDVKSRYIDLKGVRTVSPEIESPYKRTRLRGGEVLLNIRGTLGGVALVPKELAGYNIAREVAMLPFHRSLYGAYAVNLIASPFFWEMIERNLKGIAYKGLNLKILRNMPIPLPPLSEQQRIVVKVDELMALCDQLSESINNAQTIQTHLAEVIVEQAVA